MPPCVRGARIAPADAKLTYVASLRQLGWVRIDRNARLASCRLRPLPCGTDLLVGQDGLSANCRGNPVVNVKGWQLYYFRTFDTALGELETEVAALAASDPRDYKTHLRTRRSSPETQAPRAESAPQEELLAPPAARLSARRRGMLHRRQARATCSRPRPIRRSTRVHSMNRCVARCPAYIGARGTGTRFPYAATAHGTLIA